MEASALIKAHDHAKAASVATSTSDTTVAINEHGLAAGEFSNAAKTTSSIEALRTLNLLEQHHRRLSELLKFPHDASGQQSIPEDDELGGVDEKADGEGEKGAKPSGHASCRPEKVAASGLAGPLKPVPTLSQQRRYPGRDLSSSIASNLASARGIRSKYQGQPLSPSVTNDQAPGSLEARPRRDGAARTAESKRKPGWVPPSPPGPSKSEHEAEPGSTTPNDEGFSRFYNTFGSIINRLSAPLAFAGLPLIAEENSQEPAQTKRGRPGRSSSSASTDPDLSKLYSKATLLALAKDGRGPADSFYVVPTTGHTASYANIVSYDQKERRRLAASVHGDEASGPGDEMDDQDFVDARESQAPTCATHRRKDSKPSFSERNLRNVVEELAVENASLKEMLDKLSKRLHAFELNSQKSTLALAQSLRLQRPGSPLSSSGGGAKVDALLERNRELEEQMAQLRKDNAKQEALLERYRDRWDKLKAGAKARREREDHGKLDGVEPAGR